MRASCSLMGVKARVGISAVLAPMAWVHATTVGLSQSFWGILSFLPSGVNLPLAIGRHTCNAFGWSSPYGWPIGFTVWIALFTLLVLRSQIFEMQPHVLLRRQHGARSGAFLLWRR